MSPVSPDVEVFVTVDPVATVAVVIDPPTVNVVAAGQVGPKGPVGPPGGTQVSAWWNYHNSQNPPPATGQIRSTPDPGVVGSPMTLYVANRDDNGLYWDMSNAMPDDEITLRGSGGNVARCTITSAEATVPGPNGYSTLQVILSSTTGTVAKNANIEVTLIRAPAPGPQGPPGPAGPQGIPGSQIITGVDTPTVDDGQEGWYYIDTTAGILYGPRLNGIWPIALRGVAP